MNEAKQDNGITIRHVEVKRSFERFRYRKDYRAFCSTRMVLRDKAGHVWHEDKIERRISVNHPTDHNGNPTFGKLVERFTR